MGTFTSDRSVVGPTPWVFHSRPLAALEHRFEVRTDDPALGPCLEAALAPLAGDGPPEHTYTLVRSGPDSFDVLVDGTPSNGSGCPAHAVEWLLWHVNRSAVASVAGRVVLHAGAVRFQDMAVIIPGPSGAGKSTLVAGLVERGLGYLSDEVAVLAEDATTVLSYPKPVALRPGSQAALWRWRPRDHDPAPTTNQTWLVDPERVHPGSRAGPCPAGAIVSARYRRGARTELRPMSVTESLVELVSNSVHFGTPPGGDHIRVLAGLARRCRRLRLTFGDLAEACQLLADACS